MSLSPTCSQNIEEEDLKSKKKSDKYRCRNREQLELINTALDNVKNRIMTDSITKPRYNGVFDAYRQVWTETWDPKKGFTWNNVARIKNFYRVSQASLDDLRLGQRADVAGYSTGRAESLSDECSGLGGV